MRLRRRASVRSTRRSADGEPRLVLRFAIVTAFGLAIAGALILAVVREIDQRQAVRNAGERTRFVAETFLKDALDPRDVAGPVTGRRRATLDEEMRRHILIDGALRVTVVGQDGRITYSTDHRLIGTRAADARELARVRRGTISSRTLDVPAPRTGAPVKALVSSVPIALSKTSVAVVTIEQDFAPIADAAAESLLPVAAGLELALVILFVLLLPALGRASRNLRRYVAEIGYRARHDQLTGLTNREALTETVELALASRGRSEKVAVLLVDLDRFKEVNDSLGHGAGDDLLRQIARRLQDAAGDAQVSRLGGDEFAVVLEHTTEQGAIALGHALRRAIEAPATVSGIPVSVDASVGLALAPDDGDDVSLLVRRADVAMYGAKQARAGVLRYDAGSDDNDADKLVLMTELRAAVERGELEVWYQPIVTAPEGLYRKVEALVRWRHPTRGLLPPGAFVPLAEHTRLVVDLNRLVLRQATRQCQAWRRRGLDLGVTVNVTVLDLLEPTLPDDVVGILDEAGLAAEALTLEITEGAFVQEPDRVRRTLDTLRGRGVRIAIDDFGTGYSSLAYLKELPVDTLKLDRSFITDICASDASVAIVSATIDLSHGLGLEVIAEGVEDDDQFELLARLGCDLVQGYLVSAPVTAAEFTAQLEEAAGMEEQAA